MGHIVISCAECDGVKCGIDRGVCNQGHLSFVNCHGNKFSTADGQPSHAFTNLDVAADKLAERAIDGWERLLADRDEAHRKAFAALAKYKFAMFGYWAGIWVHLNQVIGDRQPNPFSNLVSSARNTHSALWPEKDSK